MNAADYTHPQFWPQLNALAVSIDGLDYFQILNLPTTATGNDIRASYYALARALHPDKFFHVDDKQIKESVTKIYKRITESYMVLKDEKKRLRYLQDISGPERVQKLRFTEESESAQREQEKLAVKVAKTPKGEQMYNAALLEMKAMKWDKAYKNIQSALMFEPGNADLKAMLEDLDKKRKGPA